MTTALLEQARSSLDAKARSVTDPRVTVGDRIVLVELTHPDHGRLAGVAHRPEGRRPGAWPTSGADLAALSTAAEPLSRAVGIATLNALSEPAMDWQEGDPMATLSEPGDVVATVGLFRPAFVTFDDVTVRVVERDPPDTIDAPPRTSVTLHSPSGCEQAFADADACFVTGSTLVYGGIGRYLAALSDAGVSPVVLIGATASHCPLPAFEAGVDIVAGACVDDLATVRTRVAAGACATDLHDTGLTKVYVTGRSHNPGVILERPGYRSDRTTGVRRS